MGCWRNPHFHRWNGDLFRVSETKLENLTKPHQNHQITRFWLKSPWNSPIFAATPGFPRPSGGFRRRWPWQWSTGSAPRSGSPPAGDSDVRSWIHPDLSQFLMISTLRQPQQTQLENDPGKRPPNSVAGTERIMYYNVNVVVVVAVAVAVAVVVAVGVGVAVVVAVVVVVVVVVVVDVVVVVVVVVVV